MKKAPPTNPHRENFNNWAHYFFTSVRQGKICTILLEQQRRAALLWSLSRAAAQLVRTLLPFIRLFRHAEMRRSHGAFIFSADGHIFSNIIHLLHTLFTLVLYNIDTVI